MMVSSLEWEVLATRQVSEAKYEVDLMCPHCGAKAVGLWKDNDRIATCYRCGKFMWLRLPAEDFL